MGSNVFGGKAKSLLAAAGFASLTSLAKQIAAGNGDGFSSEVKGVESIGVIVVRHLTSDPGHQWGSLYDRAKHVVAGLLLCPYIHLFSIFLVDKSESHIFGIGNGTICWDDPFLLVAEDDMSNVDLLGFARLGVEVCL